MPTLISNDQPSNDGEQTCSCSTAGCSCVPALPPSGPLHSPPPPPPWPMRPKRASGRSPASTVFSSAPSRSPSSATAHSHSRQKPCGAIGPSTQKACSHAPEWANKVSPALKPLVTQANLKLASPRLRLIKAAAEVVPGVTPFDTAGHTPGHISVHISSGSEEMLLTGDVVVNSAVSFLHPEWPFGFDMDVPLATKSRMAFLDRAAADTTPVRSYHLTFPGFWHVVRESGYRSLPA